MTDMKHIGSNICSNSMTFNADSPIKFVGRPKRVCQKSCTSRARIATYASSSVSINLTGGLSSGEKFLDPMNFAYAAPNVFSGRSHAWATLLEMTRGRSSSTSWNIKIYYISTLSVRHGSKQVNF
ncbi:hypothetical protein Hanom_Chr08g00690331 [Helianthus anomalus]